MILYLEFFLLAFWCTSGFATGRRVVIENGEVIGAYETAYEGHKFIAFRGLPYAKPPIGPLRFEPPEKYEEPFKEPWNATYNRPMCKQISQVIKTITDNTVYYKELGDEDCLYLNVFTRSIKSKKLKDVILFIHGGGYSFGDTSPFGPEYLMTKTEIVVVSLTYRLGPFGFLSTGDSVVPGNNGLKDQIAALKWIQRNIAAFGGDPLKVTVSGMSAGGASGHFMMLSPMAKGLFTKVYSYSGSALAPWTLTKDGTQKTKYLASKLNCYSEKNNELIDCLKEVSATDIIDVTRGMKPFLYNPFTIFGPVIEVGSREPFLDEDPIEILQKPRTIRVPWLTGVTSEDGLYPAAEWVGNDDWLKELNQYWTDIAPNILFFNDTITNTTEKNEISKKFKKVYLEDQDIDSSTVQESTQMVTDHLFVNPALESAILHAKYQPYSPVYLYMFRYEGEKTVAYHFQQGDKRYGVCHGDDVMYVFCDSYLDSRTTPMDIRMGSILVDLIVDFSKTGKPTKSLQWTKFKYSTSKRAFKFNYMDIVSPDNMQMKYDGNIGYIELKSIVGL